MQEKLERIKEFIQNDVNNVIPNMCREFAELSGDFSEYEVDTLIKDCIVSVSLDSDNAFHCSFMYDPYVNIQIDNSVATIRIADQLRTISKFSIGDFNAFARYWNSEVVNYFGQDVKFPEINL